MHPVEYSKYLLVAALAYFDFTTYAGLTAFDIGSRAVHAVTYVGVSRMALQLPVGAFVPPPRPVTATDVALYVGPAAMASSVDRLHYVPRVFKMGYRAMDRAATTLIEYHGRMSSAVYRALPPVLTVDRSAYIAVGPLWYDEWPLALPPLIHPNLTRPVFDLPLPPPRPIIFAPPPFHSPPPPAESDVPEPQPVDRRSPRSAVVVLGQCTPHRVLPTRDAIILDWDTEEVAEEVSEAVIDAAPGTEIIAGVAPNSEPASSEWDEAKQVAVYVHISHPTHAVRRCRLPILIRIFIVGYIICDIATLLIKWTYRCVFGCYRRLRAMVQSGSNESDPNTTPESDLSTPSPSTPSPTPASPTPPQAPLPPSAVAAAVAPPRSPQTHDGEGLEDTPLDPAHIPLPPDHDGDWTVPSPSPPPSPLLDAGIPWVPLPPPTSTTDGSGSPRLGDEEQPNNKPTVADAGSTSGLDAPTLPHPVAGAPDVSPDENTPGIGRLGVGEPPKRPSSSTNEADQNDGGEWTVVERKRRGARAPIAVPVAPPSQKKTRRGTRGGKGKRKEE